MTAAARDRLRSYAIAPTALVVSVPLGIVAATDMRGWLLGGVAAIVFAIVLARWFQRDPTQVIAALWAYQVLRTPLAAATKPIPVAGTLINQLTDLCLVVILLVLAWEAASPTRAKRDLRFFLPFLGLAVCGLAGSLIHMAPLRQTLAGMWLGTKLWLLVGVSATVPWTRRDVDRMLRVLAIFGSIAAVLAIVDLVTGGGVANTLNTDFRVTPFHYRSDAPQSVYTHPNDLSMAMSLLAAIWLAHVATKVRVRWQDLALLALFVAAAIVSLRLKAVLSISVAFGVVAVLQLKRGRRHALTAFAAGAVIVALSFVFMGDIIERQIETYANGGNPRALLYRTSGQIALDDAPLGVGFGRFGSSPSRNPYSSVYEDYHLSRTWGLSPSIPIFITDTSWPSVLAETGIAGALVYVAGLLALLAAGIATLRTARGPDAFAPVALLAVLAVMLVDSTGNTTLFSWNAIIPLAIVAGATLAQYRAGARERSAARRARWRLTSSRPLAGIAAADAVAAVDAR